MDQIRKIFKSVDLFFSSSGVFTYLLGAVLAQRSGRTLNAAVFSFGLLFFVCLYLLERTAHYLTSSRINIFSTVHRSKKLQTPELVWFLFFLFLGTLFCLFGLVREGGVSGDNWIWLILLSLAILIHTTSVRLWALPFRWLTDGLVISPLLLFFGAALQKISSDRVLFFLSLPLFFLYLASSTALLFENYAADLEKKWHSLLTVIGWERGISLHHILLVLSYISLGIYFYVSGAWSITWPAALAAVISLLEVYQLERIARGMKPLWGLLRASAALQYLTVLYILLFAFLIH
jgi:hypothetical protein